MFYRQKILLGLLEAFGGKLSSTDMEKLLFLYCQKTDQNHYDFFPHKYGAFSFISYVDKAKLIDKGLLKKVRYFELVDKQGHLSNLRPLDQYTLSSFAQKIGNLRGQQLLRKTYLEYPYYASRSSIIDEILTSEEYELVKNKGKTSQESTLFTIGYEGRTIDVYLNLLLKCNVNALVDVRKNPFSRKHGFSQKTLRSYTLKVGIDYHHIPELGISSSLRKNLDHEESYKHLFEHYRMEILPNQTEGLQKITRLLRKYKKIALTCFEADPYYCHRHKITELFEADKQFDDLIVHI